MRSICERFRFFYLFAVLLGAAALVRHADGQDGDKKEPDRCFLWKVSSKTNTVYLLGSMHVAKKDLFPLAKEIEDAFTGSKTLVVEVDTEAIDQAKMQKLVLQQGLYPAGETLSKNLPKKTMDALEKYCAKKGIKVETLEPFRPWMAYLLVTVGELKAMEMSEDGIDKHFLKQAKTRKKPIVELETAEAQLQLFSELTPDLQEKLLAKTLADIGELKTQMEEIVTAWKAGDAKAMEDIMLRSMVKRHPETKALMAKMFDDRNVKMAEKIDVMLKGKDSCFVVVGAGHLVGDKGIVKLLEDKQYRVEQVRRVAEKKKAA